MQKLSFHFWIRRGKLLPPPSNTPIHPLFPPLPLWYISVVFSYASAVYVLFHMYGCAPQLTHLPLPQGSWRQVVYIWTSEIPPSFPLGQESYIAKPFRFYDYQRPCADVNSPYKRNPELTQPISIITPGRTQDGNFLKSKRNKLT